MGCRFQRSSASLVNHCPQEGTVTSTLQLHPLRSRTLRQLVQAAQCEIPSLPLVRSTPTACLHKQRLYLSGPILHQEGMQRVVDISQQLAAELLSKALRVSSEDASKIFRRNAAAALCSEWDIHDRVLQLQHLFGATLQECTVAIQKEPKLLTLPLTELTSNCSELCTLCSCTPRQGRSMVIDKPFLLTLGHARVQDKLNFLKGTLCLNEKQLFPWVATHPHVLCHSMHSITDKFTWLQSFFEATAEVIGQLIFKNPMVLQLSSTRLSTELSAMSKTMHSLSLHQMVQKEPRLLTITNMRLQQRIQELQILLHVDKREALQLLVQRPSLACKGLSSLQRALRALQTLPLSEKDLSGLISAHPLLLRLSPMVLQRRCQSIQYVMRRSKVYRYTFSKLPPHLWGVVIMHWDSAANKICYLSESAQEVKMSLLDALRATSEEQFLASFPEFQKWRDWKQAGGKDARQKNTLAQQSASGGSHHTHQSRRHRPRRSSMPGVDEATMADFSHYADTPSTVPVGRYLLHRPRRPKARSPHLHTFRSRHSRSATPMSRPGHQHGGTAASPSLSTSLSRGSSAMAAASGSAAASEHETTTLDGSTITRAATTSSLIPERETTRLHSQPVAAAMGSTEGGE